MRLRQLFEAPGETVGLIFGRFNPPHKGHKAAWEMASKETHWYVGTNESTIGPKDPLPAQVKVIAMETIMPEVKDHIVFSQSWLTLASELYNRHPNATLVLFTDEAWVTKTINDYNGKEGPHGMYNFERIETKATPRLSSATALRKAVLDNNPDEFTDAAGVPADTVIEVPGKNLTFFELVAKYLEPHRDALLKKK
jgi:nicotinamide mononucleotide adenylyltransferase